MIGSIILTHDLNIGLMEIKNIKNIENLNIYNINLLKKKTYA
jgi:hypothetical protein